MSLENMKDKQVKTFFMEKESTLYITSIVKCQKLCFTLYCATVYKVLCASKINKGYFYGLEQIKFHTSIKVLIP